MSDYYERHHAADANFWRWPNVELVGFVEKNLNALRNERVLDIGCGTGRHCIYMARRGIDAWGIDSSSVGIEAALGWARGEGLRCTFEVADFQKLPHEDAFFAGAVSWGASFYGDEGAVEEGISEAFRVLRPASPFFIVMKSKDDVRWRDYPHLTDKTCRSDHEGLLMTCLDRSEVESLFGPYSDALNIERMEVTYGNGDKPVSNWLVSGRKA